MGRNGAGKSTLIKTLSRSLTPLGGEFEHSKHLKIGYFAQHQLDTLQLGQTPAQHLIQLQPGLTEQEARNFLGGFGFNGDQALEPIDQFSGGEKARLVLALMVFERPNLLLMDEPTNHLDIEMRQALTMALQEFEGAMILIAHDRHLLKATCDDLYLVDNGTVAPFSGDLDDYHKWLLEQQKIEDNDAKTSANEGKENTAVAKKEQKRLDAEMRKRISPIKKEADKLAAKQDKLENELAEIETAMSDSDLYAEHRKAELNQLLLRQGDIKSELEDVELAWFNCEEQMEAIKAEYQLDEA